MVVRQEDVVQPNVAAAREPRQHLEEEVMDVAAGLRNAPTNR
jgi:hypothetical protein